MKTVCFTMLFAVAAGSALAADTVPVTLDNFIRAESDLYMGNAQRDAGGIGKMRHNRTPAPIENQPVIRLNRDTLYSSAVFDLEAAAVTVTLPDAGGRFMSMQVIDEDHYVHGVFYGPGAHTLTKDDIGTRYVLAAIRTLVNPNDPADVEKVHALQDLITVDQAATGTFSVPNWDAVSQKKVRDALLVLGSTTSGFAGAFGAREDVDPIHHLVGTAMGWGGNPPRDATYIGVTPIENNGKTTYRLHVPAEVPVDGFWSISLYNANGYFVANTYDAYSLNSITSRKQPDGSVDVQFGGCDGKIPNCLPIMDGWNYTVRLYRPRDTILDGSWSFPEATPMN